MRVQGGRHSLFDYSALTIGLCAPLFRPLRAAVLLVEVLVSDHSHIELMCVAVESGIVRQCQESSSHTDFHVPLFASITEIQISYTILDDRSCAYALMKVCKLHMSLHQPIYMRGYGRNCNSYPTQMIM